ncbi:MAG: hypothetical protein JSW58_16555 [Candidatus Latescibacterota bacterium]|nr:MAG: hypothetical protein JSW58_16555 [Candidatus Latescibacterota bacterium]
MISGLIVSLIVLIYLGLPVAGAWVLGCAWSLVNLYVIGVLVRLVFPNPERHKARIAIVMVVKIPALYGVGYLLLWSGLFPPAGLLAGFIWPLFVIMLKAVGRIILGIDDPRRALFGSGGQVRKGL